MPQLPDASALGTRLVRPAYDVPQFPDNPIPRAIEGLGNSVAGLGSTLARNDKIDSSQAKQEADRAESYGIGSQYFQFLQQQNEAYQKAQQDYQPGSANFAKTLGDNYDAAARKFFATVPEKYRPEYDLKLQQARADLIDGKDGADQFERGQLHNYYGNQLKSNLDSLLIQQKRNPLAWDDIEEQGVRRISALDPKIFTQAEKDDYIQQWRQNRSIAFANDHPVETQKAVDDQKAGASSSLNLVKSFEGFSSGTYWDVNHHRVGYGSDTITDANGNVREVKKGDTVTREDADRDLQRRVNGIQADASKRYGAAWDNLDEPTKAALISVIYNYGSLPSRLLPALKSGDKQQIAGAVIALGGDNGGVNQKRREKEAAVIMGGDIPSGPFSNAPSVRGNGGGGASQGQLPPQIAGMGYTAYAKWQDGIDSAIAAQNVKDQAALKEHLDLGIETGDVNNKDQIMQADLPDGDKATLLRRFDEKNKTDNAEADIANNLKNDIFFDPTTADAKKGLNAFYNNVAGVAGRAYSAVQALSGTDETASAKAFSVLNWMWNRKAAPMPDDAKATLVGMSRSTDDNLMVRGLAYLSNLQAANPVGFEQTFGADTVNKVTAYNQRISTDTPAQVATAIRNTQSPEYQQNIKPMYDDAMKEASKTYDTAKVMSLFDDRGFLNWKSGLALSSPPGAPPTAKDSKGQILGSPMEMTLDFRRYYAEAVTNGVPDPEAAALSRLKTVWNVSPLNNGVVMKRPPELYYGNADWLKPNLESTLKDLGYVEKHEPIRMGRAGGQNVPDTVRPYTLMPVPRITEAQIAAKQPPQYMILIQQPSGEYDVATDKQGQMVVWPSRNDPHLEHMKEVDQTQKDNAAAVTAREAAQQADERMKAQERGEGMFGIGIMPDQ